MCSDDKTLRAIIQKSLFQLLLAFIPQITGPNFFLKIGFIKKMENKKTSKP